MSSQAHPPAIAWRVVSKVLIDGLTYEQVCSELAPMAVGSVHNILERFWRTGDVVTHQGHNPVGPPNTVMTTERVARLLECMLQTQAAATRCFWRSTRSSSLAKTSSWTSRRYAGPFARMASHATEHRAARFGSWHGSW